MLTVFGIDYIFDHDAVRGIDLIEITHPQRLLGRYDLHIKPGLFFDFTKRCLYRVFVEIDMSAGGEPFLHLFMPMQ